MKLLRFHDARLKADAGESAAPKWQMIFPKGTYHNGGWPSDGVTVDDAFCAALVANWKKRGKPELPIDYFHRGTDESVPNEERVASGWMQDLEARADGLWALTSWTDRARAKIVAGELKFLSPEWNPNGVDAHTGLPQGPTLIGAGLLNNPAFKEMPRVAASEVQPASPEKSPMKVAILAALAKAGITLAADASDDVVTATFTKYVDGNLKASAESAEVLKAKASAEAGLEALKAQVATLGPKVEALEKAKASLEAEKTETAIKAGADKLVRERRLAPAQTDGFKKFALAAGIDEAMKVYGALPQTGPELGERGHGGGNAEGELTQTEAHKKYIEAVDAAIKTGMKAAEAFSHVNSTNPQLARAAHKRN